MIVVAGSLSFDFIMNFPGYFKDQILPEKIHILNLSFLTEKLNKNFGGTAANIAYNLALLGEKPSILAPAGKDFREYKRFLDKSNINTQYIKVYRNDFTSNYFAIVDKSDNQIGGFYAGVMSKTVNLSLRKIEESIGFVVITPTEPKAMVKFAKECQELKIPYLFDPGMQLPRLTKNQVLDGVNGAKILIGNDYEISLLQKKIDWDKKKILSKVKIVVTTLAGKGSLIETKNKRLRVMAAKPRNISDPVGAGDAYRAGFVLGFLKGFDLKTCGQMGSVTAAYTVEKYGTTTHRFTKKQFCVRYKKNFGKELKLC
ncbi:MAG TPA: carbohydrate kinase family protein [Candidatus Bathyarchaeia archaeon]|nr:carbohydrate kinase family protein [Candidatus Bathyarchaeia archaeon]